MRLPVSGSRPDCSPCGTAERSGESRLPLLATSYASHPAVGIAITVAPPAAAADPGKTTNNHEVMGMWQRARLKTPLSGVTKLSSDKFPTAAWPGLDRAHELHSGRASRPAEVVIECCERQALSDRQLQTGGIVGTDLVGASQGNLLGKPSGGRCSIATGNSRSRSRNTACAPRPFGRGVRRYSERSQLRTARAPAQWRERSRADADADGQTRGRCACHRL